jgi:hypothetical protein
MRLLPGNCFAGAKRAGGLFPVLSCTTWGLSCPVACAPGGELLPRLFTLTSNCLRSSRRYFFCDTFRGSQLSSGAPAFVTRHVALWCPDFPPCAEAPSDRPLPFVYHKVDMPNFKSRARQWLFLFMLRRIEQGVERSGCKCEVFGRRR